MIARVWRGATRRKDADVYHRYLLETGVPDYRATEGNLGVHVLRREFAGAVEFLVVTFWDSMAAIHRFAGPDVERAVYYPQDPVFLLTMQPTVAHYEVLPDSGPAPPLGDAGPHSSDRGLAAGPLGAGGAFDGFSLGARWAGAPV